MITTSHVILIGYSANSGFPMFEGPFGPVGSLENAIKFQSKLSANAFITTNYGEYSCLYNGVIPIKMAEEIKRIDLSKTIE